MCRVFPGVAIMLVVLSIKVCRGDDVLCKLKAKVVLVSQTGRPTRLPWMIAERFRQSVIRKSGIRFSVRSRDQPKNLERATRRRCFHLKRSRSRAKIDARIGPPDLGPAIGFLFPEW